MDETVSDPVARQRLDVEQLETTLNLLGQQAEQLAQQLRRGDLRAALGLAAGIDEGVRAARRSTAAMTFGFDAIERAAEARRQQAQHLRTLYGVGRAINSTLDLREVLNLLMDNVVEATGAERGYVVLRDEASGALTVAAARGMSKSAIDAASFSVSRGIIAEVATRGQPVVTTNAAADPRFSALESVQQYALRAIMCAPLHIRGQIGGVVYVDNRMREGVFTRRHIELLVGIADQAGLAIDNARVFNYLQNVLRSIATGVVTVNPNGIITTFNHAAATIFGVAGEEAVGQPHERVLGLLADPVARDLIATVAAHGEPVLGYEARALVPGRGEVVLLLSIGRVAAETGEYLGVVLVTEDLTERRRMERYIAPSVVEHLRTAVAGPRPGGELREITTLFGDVQGYSTLSERISPEELLDLLNSHLALAAGAIMDPRHAGTLDKYIGDAVMGLFNTPHTQPDHAWRGLSAAWAMQTGLRQLHASLPPDRHLRFRVGVHTGTAVVGNVGAENLVNFTAIGDAVNVAKRLQETAAVGQVVFSAATFAALTPGQRARIQTRPLPALALKGRNAEVAAFELLALDVEG